MNLITEIESTLNRIISNGVVSMNKEEYDVCSFISRRIPEEVPLTAGEVEINLDDMIGRVIELMEIYGDKTIIQVTSDMLKANYIKVQEVADKDSGLTVFTTNIYTKRKSDEDNHSVSRIAVPSKLGNLSPIYLGHEIHHALKDTNPQEYQYMLRYADVIPLFFELVVADNFSDSDKQKIFDNRLSLLSSSKFYLNEHYMHSSSNLFSEMNNSKASQYLGSFYYAIALYTLYKLKPKNVLEEVRNVLLHQDTTYDLLDRNFIFGRDYDTDVSDFIKVLQKK